MLHDQSSKIRNENSLLVIEITELRNEILRLQMMEKEIKTLRNVIADLREELDDKTKDTKLEEVALAYQDIITEYYDTLALEAFNIKSHKLVMTDFDNLTFNRFIIV